MKTWLTAGRWLKWLKWLKNRYGPATTGPVGFSHFENYWLKVAKNTATDYLLATFSQGWLTPMARKPWPAAVFSQLAILATLWVSEAEKGQA